LTLIFAQEQHGRKKLLASALEHALYTACAYMGSISNGYMKGTETNSLAVRSIPHIDADTETGREECGPELSAHHAEDQSLHMKPSLLKFLKSDYFALRKS
jgi:hypothetical protein